MGSASRWFQLYWSSDEDLVDSLLRRAEAAGAEAVVVTLDTTMLGWRPQDLNLGSLPFARGEGIAQYTSDPRFLDIVRQRIDAARDTLTERPDVTFGAIRTLLSMTRNHPGRFLDNLRSPVPRAAAETFLDIYSNPGLSWEHLATLRDGRDFPSYSREFCIRTTRVARRPRRRRLVVSNHGGRQVDGSIASLDALLDIRAAIGREPTVLLDSGIRSGADVFVALALARTPYSSAGPTCTDWRSRVGRASRRWSAT